MTNQRTNMTPVDDSVVVHCPSCGHGWTLRELQTQPVEMATCVKCGREEEARKGATGPIIRRFLTPEETDRSRLTGNVYLCAECARSYRQFLAQGQRL